MAEPPLSTAMTPRPSAGPLAIGRAVVRLTVFLGMSAAAIFEIAVLRLGAQTPHGRAAWLHRWTQRCLRLFGVRLHVHGTVPTTGLVASNHLGYLDIFVLSAAAPVAFVSKLEVRSWPLAGWLAALAGTVFIDRRRRTDVKRVAQALVPIVEGGQPVVVFLEGTSTGGDRLLPFRTSLLEPAIAGGWRVTPTWVRYSVPGGSAAQASQEVCYWGDMVFFPHFLRLLGHARIDAHVVFGTPRDAAGDRRELAPRLRAEVARLAEAHGLPGLAAESQQGEAADG